MVYIFYLLLLHVLNGNANLYHCDFEIPCADFDFDENWQLTTGLNSSLINHDHTLNSSAGIYLFFNSNSTIFTQLKTSDWIQPSLNQSICFSMWYYTPDIHVPFDIQLVQGDDESLIRTVMSINANVQLNNDWTSINFRLPFEKVKIIIQLNVITGSLAFDDLSVHFCNEPQPLPKVLFSCDGESSCIDDFISLPNYPYQWSIIQAYDAVQQENQAPSIDYSFANQSGHYVWLEHSNSTEQGNVGYLATKKTFHITKEISYCLNFYYYASGELGTSTLQICARRLQNPNIVHQLWPRQSSEEYGYTYNQWTWGIINLPLGSYSLLFRVDSQNKDFGSFALDDITIASCDYQFSELISSPSLLSFSCNFDGLSQCEIENGFLGVSDSINFTTLTGDTIPDRELGPNYDYTDNSSSGGFYYWNRQTNLSADDFAIFSPMKTIERNTNMCIKFAYYVKPLFIDEYETILILDALNCAKGTIWTESVIDSQGWQLTIIRLQDYACKEKFYFSVVVQTTRKVAVAFDDIQFEQCSLINTTNSVSSSTSITTIMSTSNVVTSNSSSWTVFSIKLMFGTIILLSLMNIL